MGMVNIRDGSGAGVGLRLGEAKGIPEGRESCGWATGEVCDSVDLRAEKQ